MIATIRIALSAVILMIGLGASQAGDKKYGPGASDTEIKLGQTVPYSGPASASPATATSSRGISK